MNIDPAEATPADRMSPSCMAAIATAIAFAVFFFLCLTKLTAIQKGTAKFLPNGNVQYIVNSYRVLADMSRDTRWWTRRKTDYRVYQNDSYVVVSPPILWLAQPLVALSVALCLACVSWFLGAPKAGWKVLAALCVVVLVTVNFLLFWGAEDRIWRGDFGAKPRPRRRKSRS